MGKVARRALPAFAGLLVNKGFTGLARRSLRERSRSEEKKLYFLERSFLFY